MPPQQAARRIPNDGVDAAEQSRLAKCSNWRAQEQLRQQGKADGTRSSPYFVSALLLISALRCRSWIETSALLLTWNALSRFFTRNALGSSASQVTARLTSSSYVLPFWSKAPRSSSRCPGGGSGGPAKGYTHGHTVEAAEIVTAPSTCWACQTRNSSRPSSRHGSEKKRLRTRSKQLCSMKRTNPISSCLAVCTQDFSENEVGSPEPRGRHRTPLCRGSRRRAAQATSLLEGHSFGSGTAGPTALQVIWPVAYGGVGEEWKRRGKSPALSALAVTRRGCRLLIEPRMYTLGRADLGLVAMLILP